jgi:gluconate 5-dehydrogenase
VNAICPGFMPSKMTQGTLDKIAPLVIASTPLRQLGDARDLEGLVVLLSSGAARHITGQSIAVDGGASVV